MKANASLAVVALTCGLVFALPLAGALSWGSDAAVGVGDLRSAGASPTYGQTWVGPWMKSSGWSGFEGDLKRMRDQGVTPVVMWYYWGDSISVDCVAHGCSGRTRGDWDAMAGEMARRANAIMGGKTFIVVLEPEFNKQGISDWETFDGYLESQAWSIRGKAPSAKVAVGFGYWGGFDKFDRAVAASHYTGFQLLYGSTRNSAYEAERSVDKIVSVGKDLKARFGKPVLMFDFGVATYGGWEGVQERALRNVAARSGDIEAAGVFAIIWRYTRDNTYSSGYFGAAESTWGVKYANGANKPGFDDLAALVKGRSGAAAPTTSTTAPAPSATTAPPSAFTSVKGNAWWVQANVAGGPRSVTVSVDGKTPVALAFQPWGAWAKSVAAPTGSIVTLKATYADGTSASASYRWPGAVPVTPSAAAPATSASFTASFWDIKGNEWWVQTQASGSTPIASVSVRVDGGAWVPVTKHSWGYGVSVHAPPGSQVQFRATATDGASALSAVKTW